MCVQGDLPPLAASRPSSLAPLNKLAPLAKRSPEKKKSSLAEEVGKVAAGHAVSQLDASAAKVRDKISVITCLHCAIKITSVSQPS